MRDIYEFAYVSRSKLAPKRGRNRTVLLNHSSAPDVVSVMANYEVSGLQMIGLGSLPRDAFSGNDDGRP